MLVIEGFIDINSRSESKSSVYLRELLELSWIEFCFNPSDVGRTGELSRSEQCRGTVFEWKGDTITSVTQSVDSSGRRTSFLTFSDIQFSSTGTLAFGFTIAVIDLLNRRLACCMALLFVFLGTGV